jgi:hypothetical protein
VGLSPGGRAARGTQELSATPDPGKPGFPAWMHIIQAMPRSVVAAWRACLSRTAHVPRLQPWPTAWPLVCLDDLVVTVLTMRSIVHSVAGDFDRVMRDTEEAVRRLEAAETDDDLETLHPVPPAPDSVRRTERMRLSARFEHISFQSGYEPPMGIPGQDRWFADEANAIAHAYILRHDDAPRPWLLALHPYGAGEPTDMLLMGSLGLHRRLGVNIIHPVAPLHGPRGRQKGAVHLFGPDPVMTFLGMSQTMWDLRRWVSWVRSQGATSVSACGISFGGYCTALLAGLETGLDCAVSAAPVVDIRTVIGSNIGRLLGPDAELSAWLNEPAPIVLNRAISPLSFRPKVPLSGRYIFAAVGDQFAPPDQAVQLWHHWGKPEIRWHQGSHVSGLLGPGWRRLVTHALRRSGAMEHCGGDRPRR